MQGGPPPGLQLQATEQTGLMSSWGLQQQQQHHHHHGEEDDDPAPPMTPLLLLGYLSSSSSDDEDDGGGGDGDDGEGGGGLGSSSKQDRKARPYHQHQLQGAWAVQVNLFTALAGPTVFAMPWAFQEAGMVAGPLGLLLVAALSYCTICMLMSSKRRLMLRSSNSLSLSGSADALYNSNSPLSPPPRSMVAATPLSSNNTPGTTSGSRQHHHLTYAQVASRSLGGGASLLIKSATCLSCLGACSAYVTFTAGLITQLVPSMQQSEVLLCLLPLFIVLSWVRSFRHLAFFNILGNLSLVLGVAVLLYDGILHHHHHYEGGHGHTHSSSSGFGGGAISTTGGGGDGVVLPPLVSPSTLLLFIGPTTFLFCIHYCAIPIESDMARPSRFPWLLAVAILCMAIIDIAVGLAGLLFYGGGQLVRDSHGRVLPGCEKPVCDNVLKNISAGPLKSCMSLLFSINLIFTYAIMLAPPREYLERWWIRKTTTTTNNNNNNNHNGNNNNKMRRNKSSSDGVSLLLSSSSSPAIGITSIGGSVSPEGGSGTPTTTTIPSTNNTTSNSSKPGGGWQWLWLWWGCSTTTSPQKTTNTSRKWQKNLFRTALVVFTFGVAATVQEFGLLIAFVGGITDALQAFVLPPLIHRATHWESLGAYKRALLGALSALGLVLSACATFENSLALAAAVMLHASGTTTALPGSSTTTTTSHRHSNGPS